MNTVLLVARKLVSSIQTGIDEKGSAKRRLKARLSALNQHLSNFTGHMGHGAADSDLVDLERGQGNDFLQSFRMSLLPR